MAYISEVNDRFEEAINLEVAKKRPRLDKAAKNVGTGLVGAPACGDVMRVSVKVENGIITDSNFKIFGCGAAVASASFASELVKNKTIYEVLSITNEDIAKHLSLPPVKRHCSLLAEQALRAAITDYKQKQEGDLSN